MHVILMGPPGAGKGTQAAMLAKKFGIPHVSPGEMFRRAARAGTPLGLRASSYMEKGALVPDDITVGTIKERLSEDDCRAGFILDGFPRNLAQAGVLQAILEELELPFDGAISIEVPVEELVRRSVGRRVCRQCGRTYHLESNPPQATGACDACGGELFQRSDDREETVRNRLKVYHEHTAVLLDYYRERGELWTVDGNRPIDRVLADLSGILQGLSS